MSRRGAGPLSLRRILSIAEPIDRQAQCAPLRLTENEALHSKQWKKKIFALSTTGAEANKMAKPSFFKAAWMQLENTIATISFYIFLAVR
jgi:hypothetical protein